jgi:hypothetical protein
VLVLVVAGAVLLVVGYGLSITVRDGWYGSRSWWEPPWESGRRYWFDYAVRLGTYSLLAAGIIHFLGRPLVRLIGWIMHGKAAD